jgi:hypothetical protein
MGFGIMALLVSKHTIITFDRIIIYYVQDFETPATYDGVL